MFFASERAGRNFDVICVNINPPIRAPRDHLDWGHVMPRNASNGTSKNVGPGPGPSASETPRVYVVSEVRLYRDGLVSSLTRHGGVLLVGAGDRAGVLGRLESIRPDVMLLDVSAPDSLALPRRARLALPSLHVIAFAVKEAEADVLACAEAGFSGYVPQDGSVEDLVEAVRRTVSGELVCPPRIASSLFSRLGSLAVSREAAPAASRLTPREREIAALVAHGLPNKEVARRLGVSGATIKNHVHNILQKLNLQRRGEIARLRIGPPLFQSVLTSALLIGAVADAL
jgi:two-component system, NarL family, nitrate/nitrite response regulator NarL